VDVLERGAGGQALDRRLFMHLSVWTGVRDAKPLAAALEGGGIEGVLYQDTHDPRGAGVLALAEDPASFATRLRDVLAAEPFAGLAARHALAMLGRTYASGYEADLEDWLLHRPRRGPSGTRCAAPAPSPGSRGRSRAPSCASTGRWAGLTGRRDWPTTSASPVRAWTPTTTTS
jgi:hypothetical protein